MLDCKYNFVIYLLECQRTTYLEGHSFNRKYVNNTSTIEASKDFDIENNPSNNHTKVILTENYELLTTSIGTLKL